MLTAATLYFDTGEDAQLKAMKFMTHFYLFSVRFILAFVPLVESAYAMDLVLILRNPFADNAARTPKWLAAATLTALVFASVANHFIRDEFMSQIFFQIPRLVFFIVWVPAIPFALYRLRQPGLSQKFRKDYMMRQLVYFGFMFLI